MSYSIDFRGKVIFTIEEEGLSIRETAKQFRIGSASVSRWINQIEPKASTTRQRKIDKFELIKDVEQYQNAYQKERAKRFGVCHKAIWQALKKMGLTYKKNSTSSESRRKHSTNVSTKKQYEKKASILFLLMKVVFYTIPRGLTAIPRKVNGVLVSRTEELKKEQMLSALYWAQRCLLSDYLISILTAMFSMHGSPKSLSQYFLKTV
ncbi:IS630 transposase-related protein [Arsenophonus endosymbiont of Bemisia tabaci]|uniref:IS630 transposase-related protein n=1 Tax=Arsenophonus endosymbiont of Bemisia tabaci TaxID=536059 RepID=UPI00192D8A5C|nr:IS630 transposase-related protein [Arsenophonus endosymbiont of Bemisia tabaci]